MRNILKDVYSVAVIPVSVYGERAEGSFYVTINGERRFRLVQGVLTDCWYARVGTSITRLGGRREVERWIQDSLIAERLRAGEGLH